MFNRIINADVFEGLAQLPDCSVQCCVTSPPYFSLRDYGCEGQIGLEKTPDEYVAKMVAVFAEVRRVLRKDGTLWLNLGDSFASQAGGYSSNGSRGTSAVISAKTQSAVLKGRNRNGYPGIKPKDLIGIPWRVAFALQADGWLLRQDIVWHKPNAMPESVRDRCTRAHEFIFMLTKSPKYYYDSEAIKVPGSEKPGGACFGKVSLDGPGSRRISAEDNARIRGTDKQRGHSRRHAGFNDRWDAMERTEQCSGMVNKRSVWKVATRSNKAAHFAMFPPQLIEPCILAGCPAGGVVLDPFGGSGTTCQVAKHHGRQWIMFELNPAYIPLAEVRINTPLKPVNVKSKKPRRPHKLQRDLF